MILQALKRLAQQEQLVADPDYEFKRVSWQVVLKPDGSFVNLVSYRQNVNEATKRKAKYVGKWISVPRQPARTSGDLAFFFVDKAEYVFGYDPAGKQQAAKVKSRAALFRRQIEACANETQESGAKAVLAFLKSLEVDRSIIRKHPSAEDLAPNDLIGFAVESGWVHHRPKIKEFWHKLRNPSKEGGAKPSDRPVFQCLVTGEPVTEVPLFPLIKKVPGGTSSGVALVSHNASAFYSYDLKGNDNAPLSRDAAEACAAALTRLLDDGYPNPSDSDSALPKRFVRLGSNTVVCFWARDKNEESEDFLDVLPDIVDGEDEEKVESAYHSIWNGKPIVLKNPNEFYALTLSGTQGRVVVRDWLETSLQQVNTNLSKHFTDLRICRNTRPKKGRSASPAVPLGWLLKSLTGEGRTETVPPTVESGFVRSAIHGTPYPFQLLQRALVRTQAEAGGEDWSDSMRRDARAAVIKAVLNRRREIDPRASQRYPEVEVEMNPTLDSPGYTLGMLMAVLERLQALALGDINASLVDRFFSAASASPRSVFIRLLKNSQHHYRKVRDHNDTKVRGSARYMERLKDSLLHCFDVKLNPYPPKITGIPTHLNLEQQGLFVLGYHQMRYWLWMTKDERAQWEQQHPDAPAVYLRKKQEETELEEPEAVGTD